MPIQAQLYARHIAMNKARQSPSMKITPSCTSRVAALHRPFALDTDLLHPEPRLGKRKVSRHHNVRHIFLAPATAIQSQQIADNVTVPSMQNCLPSNACARFIGDGRLTQNNDIAIEPFVLVRGNPPPMPSPKSTWGQSECSSRLIGNRSLISS